MSTKALKEALGELSRIKGMTQVQAYKELEAIAKAAHLVTNVGQSEASAHRYNEWKAACELLRSIAAEEA